MAPFAVTLAGGAAAPGEAYAADTPALAAHAGTQPDLFLRWNRIPLSAAAVDVVVHLHGYSQQGRAMALAEKVPRSGLDLCGRARPTLALLPRGNWLRHYYYDFPVLLDGGLDELVAQGLRLFGEAIGAAAADAAPALGLDRLIVTAHSGGGMPAVDALAGARNAPDELHIFDGLYGRDPSLGDPLRGIETLDRWLADRLAAEPGREGALRVIYIEQQTGPFSRALAAVAARHLAATGLPSLGRRYRVEAAIGVQHSQIAARCGPQLLASPDADIDWWR